MAAGAAGFMLKHNSSHELSRAIREVQKGNSFFSPSIARRLRDQRLPATAGPLRKPVARLSARELEVLQFIADKYGAKNLLYLPPAVASQIIKRPADFLTAVKNHCEPELPF